MRHRLTLKPTWLIAPSKLHVPPHPCRLLRMLLRMEQSSALRLHQRRAKPLLMSGSLLTMQGWAFSMLFDSCVVQQKVSLKCMFGLGAFLLDSPACFVMLFQFFTALLWGVALYCPLYMYIIGLMLHRPVMRRYQQIHWYVLVL